MLLSAELLQLSRSLKFVCGLSVDCHDKCDLQEVNARAYTCMRARVCAYVRAGRPSMCVGPICVVGSFSSLYIDVIGL